MQINFNEEVYELDIPKVFDEATDDDYIDCLNYIGVIVHNSPLPDGFVFIINYNFGKDIVNIYLENEETDFCAFIKECNLNMTKEERERIVKELSFI